MPNSVEFSSRRKYAGLLSILAKRASIGLKLALILSVARVDCWDLSRVRAETKSKD